MTTSSRATDDREATTAAAAVGSNETRLNGLRTGIEAGLVATLVMSAFRTPISRSPPPTAWFWAKFVGEGDPGDYGGRGILLHLLYGAGGGAMFGALLGPHLAGRESKRERWGTLLGVVYSLILAAFGSTVVLDRVLDLDLDADEKYVFHVSHVVYGLTLGTWFGSRN